jgi:hypothetical protein
MRRSLALLLFVSWVTSGWAAAQPYDYPVMAYRDNVAHMVGVFKQ